MNIPFLGSKERDSETGLDYFLARYMSSIQGRFTGIDPLNPVLEYRSHTGSEEERKNNEIEFLIYLGQPQNWNRYSYVTNNPIAMIDPDGREGGYAYMPDGRMIAPGEPNYPKTNRPVRDTLIIGGVAALAILAPEYLPALVAWMIRNPGAVQRGGQEMIQMSQGNPLPAPGLGSLPKLSYPASGNNGELFREIMGYVKSVAGSGSQKAALFEALAAQGKQITGGSFEAVRVASRDGSYLYAGRGAEILVITQAGRIYRGTQQAVTFSKGVATKIDFDKLKEVRQ
ncbi:MAG: hypothetical protein KIT57_18900 [Blastocatellales bacterium]|nr:hypothetical protein [Blastocatellales bacterium]